MNMLIQIKMLEITFECIEKTAICIYRWSSKNKWATRWLGFVKEML